MNLQRLFRKIHKTLGLIVGVQVLLWMASGLYMTAIPIDTIRGNEMIDKVSPSIINSTAIFPVQTLLQKLPNVTEVVLINRLSLPVYKVSSNNDIQWFNGLTGEPLEWLTQQQITEIAIQAFKGDANLKSVTLIANAASAPDARGRTFPLWQAIFTDTFETTLYLTPELGNIVAVRTDLWRLFDIFWMLHIMDYDERDNFNNPLVIFMVTVGLFLSLSGWLLVFNIINKKGLAGVIK